MGHSLSFIAAAIFGILVVVAMSIFTVDQRKFAIVLQLGEIKDVIAEPGLNFKWPLIWKHGHTQDVRFANLIWRASVGDDGGKRDFKIV